MKFFSVLLSLSLVGAISAFGQPIGKVHVRMIDSSEVFDMSLDSTRSVESIKSKAHENWNVPLDKQTLYLAPHYTTLEDGHTVGDYDVTDGSTIWVHVQNGDSKQVFVRKIGDSSEQNLGIPYDGTHTVGSLKATIEENWNIPTDKQILYFGVNYVPMEDDDQTLADYNVLGDTKAQVDSTIWLHVDEDQSQKKRVFVRRIGDSTTQALELPLGQADSVKTVKTHIQDILNIPTSDQTLYFGPNHIPMEDDQTLGHYNVVPNHDVQVESTIWLFVQQNNNNNNNRNQNQLFIREFGTSKTMGVPVDKSETVRSMKSKIEANWGIPVEKQTLYLAPHYTVLEDDQSIGDYKIEGTNQASLESIIWLFVEPKQ